MAAFPGLLSFPDRPAGFPATAAAGAAFADREAVAAFARVAAWFGGLLFATGGTIVAGRRFAGAFATPPGILEFVILLGGGAVVLATTTQACRLGGARGAAGLARAGFAAVVLAVGLPSEAVSWSTAAAPVMAVAAAAVALIAPMLVGPAATPRTASAPPAAGDRRRRRRSRPAASPLPGRLSQRQERYRLPSGDECIRGRIHLEIPAGARAVHGHLGFCPAFGELPEVHVETPYDGVEAVVAAAEVVPWGVRIECRLAEPAEEAITIPVLVLATARA